MAVYNWSTLTDLQNILFNPTTDVLHIDDSSLSAADFIVEWQPFFGSFTDIYTIEKGVFLAFTYPHALHSGNFTFADGSVFRMGDQTTNVPTQGLFNFDDAAQTLSGGSGDDLLIGAGGADSLYGAGGNDTFLVLGALTNTLPGGPFGNDTINGGGGGRDYVNFTGDVPYGIVVNMGNETAAGSITGGDGISGVSSSSLTLLNIEGVFGTDQGDLFNANSSTLVTGLRTDIVQRFEPMAGNDIINGATGDGRTTYLEYRETDGSGVIVNLGTTPVTGSFPGYGAITVAGGTARDGLGTVDTFNNIDGVVGSFFNDTLVGGGNSAGIDRSQREFFEGMAGNDRIDGQGGSDRVQYDSSPFAVVVNLGTTPFIGTPYGTVNGGTARDGWTSLGGGTDTLISIEQARGSDFNDWLRGGSGNNLFEGRGGSDFIDGGSGDDRARYTNSTSAVVVNLGSNSLVGNFYGAGTVTVFGGQARDGTDTQGGATDTLINIEGATGSDQNDTLVGGSGDQDFEGGAGNDSIDGGGFGGDDTDLVRYNNATGAVYVDLGAGIARAMDTVTGAGIGVDTLLDIEGVRGSLYGDSLVGAAGDGNESYDSFEGMAGNDTMDGGVIDGGVNYGLQDYLQDYNIAAYTASPNAVIVNLGAGNVVVGSVTVAGGTARDGWDSLGGGTDTLSNFNAAEGSAFNDTLVGNDGDNAFQGRAGNDSIVGGAGMDFLSYADSPNRVFVNLGATAAASPFGTVAAGAARDGWDSLGGGTDSLSGIEWVEGSDFNDTLIGGDGGEIFSGGIGNDSLVGGAGIDTAVFDDFGPARVIVNLSDGAITVSGVSVAAFTARDGSDTAGGGTDVVRGFENVVGSHLSDFIIGNSAANLFEGNEGNDTLVGGTGAAASTVPGAGGDFANDTLLGHQGGDFLRHTRGNDWMDGGADFDWLTFVNSTGGSNNGVTYGGATGVNVNLATGVIDFNTADTITGGALAPNTPVLISIEGVAGSGGNDVLIGGSLARATSGTFSEGYRPGGGNDIVFGNNSALGTARTLDRVDYSEAPAAAFVNFGPNPFVSGATTIAGGTARDGSGGTDLLFNIDWAVGTSFADALVGGSVRHNDGERFEGRGGNDTLIGGAGTDQAYYANSPGAVNVNLATGIAFDGHGGVDMLSGIEQVRGSRFNDVITGGSAGENLTGDRGNDTIDGGAGTDIVSYSAHPVDAGGIFVNFSGSTASPVTLSVYNGFEFETDTLFNIEGVTGTNSNDTLIGGTGNQHFQGTGGDDLIDGGLNTDTARYSGDPRGAIVNLSTSVAAVGADAVAGGTALDGNGGIFVVGNELVGAANDDNFSLLRAVSAGNPLVGSWHFEVSPTEAGVFTFLSDGTFLVAADAGASFGGSDGIEHGTYTGNGSGAFTSSILVDTNGAAGLSYFDINSITVLGNDLTLAADQGAFVFTRVVDASDPLVGGWYLPSGDEVEAAVAVTFLADGNYFLAQDGDSVAEPGGQDGMERGARDWDPLTGKFTSVTFIDTNGEWGLSDIDGLNGGTDTLISIENVLGSRYADTLVGGAGANRLEGNDGNDEFWVRGDGGASGNDTLDGGAGTDLVSYQNVQGYPINANLHTGILTGGDGSPGSTLTLINVEDVYGTAFNDTFTESGASPAGSLSTDNLAHHFQGAEGNDTLVSSVYNSRTTFADYTESPGSVIVNLGSDSIVAGADTVFGNSAHDGWGGTDSFVLTNSGDIDGAIGSMNADTLVGGGQGHLGSGFRLERFEGLAGDDYIDGGDDQNVGDLAEYTFSPAGVDVNLGTGVALDGWGGTDTLVDIRWVRGSPFADVLTGSDLDQEEAFEGLGGNDTLNGGAEFDNVYYYLSPEAVYVNLGLGIGRGLENAQSGGLVPSAVGIDTLIGIEAAHGSDFNDSLVGGSPGGQPPPGQSLASLPAWEVSLFLGSEEFEGFAGNDVLNAGDTSAATLDIAVYRNAPTCIIFNLSAAAVTSGGITVGTNQSSDGQGVGTTPMGFDTLVNINGVEGTIFWDTLVGGAGNDYFIGGQGNDSIIGGAGVDTLSYDYGSSRATVSLQSGTSVEFLNDTLVGGTDTFSGIENVIGSQGNDNITGDAGANLLAGDDGNDTLAGGDSTVSGGANDSLYGGDGDDRLFQTRGADRIDGGDGFDRLSYSIGGTFAVNVNLAAGTANAGGNIATVTSVEAVDGTAGNDTLTGGDPLHAPALEGGQNEQFRPLGGNDTVTGKDGHGWFTTVDYSNVSGSSVTVMLGNGNNLGFASDGQGGTDTLINVDQVLGGGGNDLLIGGSYATSVNGGFFESFRGNAGSDTLDGGGSDTTLGPATSLDRVNYSNSPFAVVANIGTANLIGNFYGAGTITVAGGTARDGFSATGGSTDWLFDIDVIQGSNFNDTLLGGNPASDDFERFEGRGGSDWLDGGSGDDEADYANQLGPVFVDLEAGTADDGQGGTDTLIGIEYARGSDFDDTLIGGAGDTVRLGGGIGDDYIDGGSGGGIHYASFISGSGAVIVNLATSGMVVGSVTVNGGTALDGQGGTDTLVNIDGVWGSHFNDTLLGGAGSQHFKAQARNDYIDGGDGEDFVTYRGDPNSVIVNLGTAPVVVGLDTVLGGTARDGWGGIWNLQGIDTLMNIENIEGSRNDDTLVGAPGGGGLHGRAGNDSLVGGAGRDEVIYRDATEAVNVNLQTGIATDGQGGTDTLTGIEEVRGSDFADTLTGSDAAGVVEVFDGSMGNDTIDGGGGIDFASWATVSPGGAGVSASLSGGSGSGVNAVMGTDTLVNIEGLEGTMFGDTLTGSAGDQILRGNEGADSLTGGANTDTVDYATDPAGVVVNLSGSAVGGVAADRALDGWGDTDTLSGIENVVGSGFNDTLAGSSAANQLSGGAGDDSIAGGDGVDTLDGGAGIDTVDFQGATGTVSIDLATGVVELNGFGDAGTATGFERVVGGNFNDTLIGTSGNDTLTGGAGSDSMVGGAGNDVYFTDGDTIVEHADSLVGGIDTIVVSSGGTMPTGIERLKYVGGEGAACNGNSLDNFIEGNDAGQLMDGNAGIDTISYVYETGAVTIDLAGGTASGSGTDTLADFENAEGGAGDDSILGSTGDNVLDGSGGADTLEGGTGNDTYIVDSLDDVVVESDALAFRPSTDGSPPVALSGPGGIADAIVAAINFSIESLGGIENLTLSGPLAFTARGNLQANVITGNALGNTLIGAAGDDTLIGGAGTDTADYSSAPAAVNVNLASGTASDGEGGTDTLDSIENVIGSGFNDTVLGSTLDNRLQGGDGADSLVGGAANDVLEGGTGNDTLDGGTGTGDTLDYSNAGGAIVVNLGTVSVTAPVVGAVAAGTARGDGIDRVLNVEAVIGGSGNDTLVGGVGNETLIGGAGNDSLVGGAGNDTYGDVAAGDRLNDAGGIDTIVTAETHTLGAAFEILVLTGEANLDGTGNALANLLAGNSGDNRLNGGAANDTIAGGAGHDRLDGGLGVDSMLGGAGDDVYFVDVAGDAVSEAVDAGTDTVVTMLAYTAGGNVENVTLTGIAAVNATGNALVNILTGNNAVNVLNGLTDDDVLIGGGGNDVFLIGAGSHHGAGEFIDGGAGTDVIRFTSTAANDTLTLSTGIAAIEAVAISDAAGGATGSVALNVDAAQVEGALSITGNAGSNALTGGYGNDTLNGGLGMDVLAGGDGDDWLFASAAEFSGVAAESLIGGDGTDIIVYTGTAVATLDLTGANLDSIEGLQLTGTAAIHINAAAETNGVFLAGNTAGNTLTGSDHNDTLAGSGGADTINGGLGDDLVIINAAADFAAGERINGGAAGTDTLRYTSTAAGTLTLTTFVDDIEQVEITGAGAAVLNASVVENSLEIQGGAGNDLITGTTGFADSIDGGAGNDTLFGGGGGIDALNGGAGNDVFIVNTQAQLDALMLDGGDDSDTIRYTGTAAGLTGGTLVVNSATDIEAVELSPVTGAVAINVNASAVNAVNTTLAIIGNAANNMLTGGGAANLLVGNAGNDTLLGGDGNDTLNGGVGNDSLSGGDDDDLFLLAALADMTAAEFLDGGVDFDTLRYTGAAASLVLGTGALTNLANLEAVQITDAAGAITGTLAINVNAGAMGSAFAITGNNGANRFDGTAFNDILAGNGGIDTLVGGAGDDFLSGGDGNDLFLITDSAQHGAAETIGGGLGTDTVRFAGPGVAQNLVFSANVTGIELVVVTDLAGLATGTVAHSVDASPVTTDLKMIGNNGDNKLTGGSGNDSLDGGVGADTLVGGGGNDTLNGAAGAGNDRLIGGLGDDLYLMDSISDLVQEGLGEGTDTVLITLAAGGGHSLANNADNLTLLGTAAVNGAGNILNNVITGNSAANQLSGDDGNDTIIGGGGADTLNGGANNDVFLIAALADMPTAERIDGGDHGAGGDVLRYTGTTAATLSFAANVANTSLLGNVEVVEIANAAGVTTGTAAINVNASAVTSNGMTLTGNDGANLLTGTGLADVLNGNGGNDSLMGGNGADSLAGGAGADTLIGGTGVDTLSGGAGNDILIWDAVDGSIDGGGDTDTLVVNGAVQSINLIGIADALIANVEIINLTGTGNNELALSLADVLAISSSTDTLRIDGNAGDKLYFGGWEQGANQVIGANTYLTFTQGPAVLLVDSDITRLPLV